jgi:hypothetical protein
MPTSPLGSLHHEWLAWHQPLWAACMLAVLWGQDSIWKTFQNRIAQRLLSVESALTENHSQTGMQFNSVWLASRPDASGLLLEYLKQAFKPTVAFPHIVMIGLGIVYYILY